MTENVCPCGTGKSFTECCEPFHLGKAFPTTAEQLMRSRYSAYVVTNVDYLIGTTHPSMRRHYSRKEIRKWSQQNQWLRLEIVTANESTVEFKAFYKDRSSALQIHHERSLFGKVNDRWYYIEGT